MKHFLWKHLRILLLGTPLALLVFYLAFELAHFLYYLLEVL